jgi:hypothetical protein
MKVDLYKRPDTNGGFSYLAVPAGKPIPNEATNIDWQTVHQGEELRPEEFDLLDASLDELEAQFDEKGYAISSAQKQMGTP